VLVEVEPHADQLGSLDDVIEFFHNHDYSGEYFHNGAWRPIEGLDRVRTAEMGARVARHGYLLNNLLWARHYIHNFLFRPS
jgi:hypothetical protein